ncbi:MAG: ABC-F family ATP-binding cassette domain-containing protein, partial [Oscillospiraceae bacterium]|nr:ABC-F family ATP-binding cassette domain-containing protein [Oscillospiraceae bacterium]
MVDIQVTNLTKFFVIGENLLQGLSFEIQEGERVAILGRNGCGKTTLLKILTGEMDYDDGEVYINPHKKIGLISQIPVFPVGYTVEKVLRSAYTEIMAVKQKMETLEKAMAHGASSEQLREYDNLTNRFQSGGGYEMDVEVDKICNGLGITADQRQQEFDSLSGGEKTRMNLARLLLEKTDILLLDEPTNHLDLNSVEWLEGYINAFKGTVVAISHDRYFIDRIAQRVIEIVDGHAEFYSGNYSFYMDEKQARFDLQLKQYEQEQAKLKQLGFTVERMKGWGINNRTLYRRAMSIQHRMERIKKTEKPKKERTMKASFGEKDFSGDIVFKMKGVSKAFGPRTLFSDVNLTVEGGERIALLGDNGTGKSTFIKCLLGEEDCGGKLQF